MRPRTVLSVAVLLLWSLFTWGGRIRNALADDALDASERGWALALACSFVVPALVLAAGWWWHTGRPPWTGRAVPPVGRALRVGTLAFAAWTTGVWLVRGIDIALFSDHEVGFVVVHSVLAVVAIGLSVLVAAGLVADDRAPAVSADASR